MRSYRHRVVVVSIASVLCAVCLGSVGGLAAGNTVPASATAAGPAVSGSELGAVSLSYLAPLVSDGRNPVDALASAVAQRGSALPSALYGGTAEIEHGESVNVYLTRLSPTAERDVLGDSQTSKVHFIRIRNSYAELMALQQRILADADRLKAEGINLEQWGPDVWTGQEIIVVRDLAPSSKELLDKAFGMANLIVESTPKPYGAIATARNRLQDYSPWNDGDFTEGPDPYMVGYVDDCTSGYGVQTGAGTKYLLSAAHCWNTGASITNYSSALASLGDYGGTNNFIGKVGRVDTEYGGNDAELINTRSSPAVWTAGSTNPQTADVSGVDKPVAGTQVCEDGAYEGEICGLVVKLTDQCINLGLDNGTTRYVCHETEAVNPGGGIANGQGDSGSGAFNFHGSLLEAAGIDSAGSNPVPCAQYVAPQRLCFSTLYYDQVTDIDADFSVTPNT